MCSYFVPGPGFFFCSSSSATKTGYFASRSVLYCFSAIYLSLVFEKMFRKFIAANNT